MDALSPLFEAWCIGVLWQCCFFCQHGPKMFPNVNCLLSSEFIPVPWLQAGVVPSSFTKSFDFWQRQLWTRSVHRNPTTFPPDISVCNLPSFCLFLKQSDPGVFHKSLLIPSDMIIRLGRLTPGYFRLLQVFFTSPHLETNTTQVDPNITCSMFLCVPPIGLLGWYMRTCWPLF